MKGKIFKTITAILILMALTMTNFIYVGVGLVSYAESNVATNNQNVEFGAQINNGKLNLELSVKKDGYFNGDIGIVKELGKGKMVADIRGEMVNLCRDALDDVQLAYGMTIHKSQGSEFKNAIVVMPSEPANMLVRNLLYTGVTRAKKKSIYY